MGPAKKHGGYVQPVVISGNLLLTIELQEVDVQNAEKIIRFIIGEHILVQLSVRMDNSTTIEIL